MNSHNASGGSCFKIPLSSSELIEKNKKANADTPKILSEIRSYFTYDSSTKIRSENLLNDFTNLFNNVYTSPVQQNYQSHDKLYSYKENQEVNPHFHQSCLPFKPIQNTYIPSYQPPVFPSYNEGTGELLTGRIKFFDSTQNYGFFILDKDGSDLFVHYDNFLKAGITKEHIQMARVMNMRFSFHKVNYYGKYKLSSKAVDINLIQDWYNKL